MKSYKDLADAVEDLKRQGYSNLSKQLDGDPQTLPEEIERMSILHTYRFDGGTDPSDESTLYLLEFEDDKKGFIVLGYGTYRDPEKSRLIEALKKLEHSN